MLLFHGLGHAYLDPFKNTQDPNKTPEEQRKIFREAAKLGEGGFYFESQIGKKLGIDVRNNYDDDMMVPKTGGVLSTTPSLDAKKNLKSMIYGKSRRKKRGNQKYIPTSYSSLYIVYSPSA